MNKISKLFLAIAVASLPFVSSCRKDNYKQPNAAIYGSVIDIDTGEPIYQDIGDNGSRIQLKQLGFETGAYKYLNFKSDGTYCESNLFAGTYSFGTPSNTNFISDGEEEEIYIKGNTCHDIVTSPYLRINVDSIVFVAKKKRVEATFTLEAPSPMFPAVKNIGLFCSDNPNVSFSLCNTKVTQDVGSVVNDQTTYVLRMDVSLLSDGNYYFRVGALSDAPEAKYNYSEATALHIVIDHSYVETRPGLLLMTCDDASLWNPGHVEISNDVDHVYGTGSIATTGNSLGGPFFWRALEKGLDISKKIPRDCAALLMTYYVSDPSFMPENGQVELTSSGTPDHQEIAWQNRNIPCETGWNTVMLPFSESVKNDGDIDISNINFFRMYTESKKYDSKLVVKLNELRIVYPTQFDNCDSDEDWLVVSKYPDNTSVDETDYREGTGSICLKDIDLSGTVQVFKLKKSTPFKTPGGISKDNGVLRFQLYVSDGEAFSKATSNVEITSSGKSDENEYQVRGNLKLSTGWNTVDIPLSSASKIGTPNLKALNYFRIHFEGLASGNYTLRIDDLHIYQSGYDPALVVEE
ncbi:MAG: DUF3823 domain-containing protein [Bacteroidales bacterium]|nr:DUF3823 domain-containing protein [Bacteroidales bacterium]